MRACYPICLKKNCVNLYNPCHPCPKTTQILMRLPCVAGILQEYLPGTADEKRMLVKQIIKTAADLWPGYENKKLVIVLISLSAPRFDEAVKKNNSMPERYANCFSRHRSGFGV